jgi:hypothetical protein
MLTLSFAATALASALALISALLATWSQPESCRMYAGHPTRRTAPSKATPGANQPTREEDTPAPGTRAAPDWGGLWAADAILRQALSAGGRPNPWNRPAPDVRRFSADPAGRRSDYARSSVTVLAPRLS